MSKRNFLKKALSKFIVLVLCFAFSLGIVACDNQASLYSGSGTGAKGALTVWTIDGNVEKILQKRLNGESINYSTYYNNKEFIIGVFQNETEASNIVLTAGNKDIKQYNIQLSDLKSGSNTLSKSAFMVYNQKYIENTPKEGIYGGGWYPDCLLPFKTAVEYKENFVKAGTHQAIYIAVKPQKDQAPGIYKGEFKITADGKDYKVPVEVEVYDFMLPTEPIGDYAAGPSVDNMQAGELDCTQEMIEAYYEYFLDYRCSPGHVPGSVNSISTNPTAFNEYYDEWVQLARKYTRDERVGFINLPYNGWGVDITYKTEKKDASGKIIYEKDSSGKEILDEDGNPIPVMEEKTETHNIAGPALWVNGLRKMAEGCFYDENGDGVYTDDEFVNLFSKASTYFVYFDEFSSTAGKDLTAISTLQWVVYAATMVGDEYKAKWESDSTPKLTENEQAVIDSMLSIKHRAISTSTAPLEKSDYVVKMEYEMKDNETFSDISDWTKNYKYYDDDGNLRVTYNGSRGTFIIEEFTECVFVTGITNYATETSRAEYHNYAEQCQLYNHEKWVYTAENPKYPSVNNHLDTSLWGIRAMGWMQADWDANGNLYWSSTLCRQYVTVSPLYIDYLQDYYQTSERYRGTNGDGYIAYVGRPYGIFGPLGSIRLHAIRDGNEDYDLLYYLEQFYVDSAEAMGQEYSDVGYKNVLHTMTDGLYDGVDMINSTSDTTIYKARKLVAELLAMGDNTGAVVENYEIIEDTIRFTVSAPSDVTIKFDGQVKSGVTVGERVVYEVYVNMASSAKTVKITAEKNGQEYSANFVIESIVSRAQAGKFYGSGTQVLPSGVNAGSTEKVTETDKTEISALKGSFKKYLEKDPNGQYIKVDNKGNIAEDFVEIDVTNTLVDINKYILIEGKYEALSFGNLIKSTQTDKDGNPIYFEFANTNDDYFDKNYGKLKRYIFDGIDEETEEAKYKFDMNGSFIKGIDGNYYEVDLTDLDESSIVVLSYKLVDGVFVESSNGEYLLKAGGDINNPSDYVKPMDGEVGNRYTYGVLPHELQINISSLNVTAKDKLISIKVMVSEDVTITVGAEVRGNSKYLATEYNLKAGEWNEIQVSPSMLGAKESRKIDYIRLRCDGVKDGLEMTAGKIFVIK